VLARHPDLAGVEHGAVAALDAVVRDLVGDVQPDRRGELHRGASRPRAEAGLVAVGRRERLQVFGNDYDTPDGTGVRDYIHVCDLAEGHVAALRHLFDQRGSLTVNLGTGRGYSVLEVVRAYERASGREVPYEVVARRPGDVATCYADASLARSLLGWRAEADLVRMCADSWRWQQMNPHGFEARTTA
jgi:UDP-glucose 4-epimerase